MTTPPCTTTFLSKVTGLQTRSAAGAVHASAGLCTALGSCRGCGAHPYDGRPANVLSRRYLATHAFVCFRTVFTDSSLPGSSLPSEMAEPTALSTVLCAPALTAHQRPTRQLPRQVPGARAPTCAPSPPCTRPPLMPRQSPGRRWPGARRAAPGPRQGPMPRRAGSAERPPGTPGERSTSLCAQRHTRSKAPPFLSAHAAPMRGRGWRCAACVHTALLSTERTWRRGFNVSKQPASAGTWSWGAT